MNVPVTNSITSVITCTVSDPDTRMFITLPHHDILHSVHMDMNASNHRSVCRIQAYVILLKSLCFICLCICIFCCWHFPLRNTINIS